MTRKPCPCCKEVKSSRKADDICYNCRKQFNSIKQLKAIIIEEREKAGFNMPIILGPSPHWNKNFHLPGQTEFQHALQKLFYELALAASVQSSDFHASEFHDPEGTYLLGTSSEIDGERRIEAHRYMNAEVAKSIMELHNIIEPFATEMYNFGLEDAVRIRDKLDEIRKIIRS